MTRGVDAPERYYYRWIMTDAARAVDAVRAHPSVDPANFQELETLGFLARVFKTR